MTPDIDFTPAGGSPPRPVPKIGDRVQVARLPDQCDARLKMWQIGIVYDKNQAMYRVRFAWGFATLAVVQLELAK